MGAGWQTDGQLSWRQLTPYGVEVRTNLAGRLEQADIARLVRLFWRHSLLVAPGQQLSLSRQREVLGWFGPVLLRDGESGVLSNQGEHAVVRSGLAFHADAAYTEHPFEAIALHALDVVDGASSTRFAHAERALAKLPERLRQAIASREVDMITPGFSLLEQRVCDVPDPEFMQRGRRPTILENPHSGQSYLNLSEMHAAQLVGLEWADSRELLRETFDYLYAPDNIAEHIWRRGDLVIWDNRALQHARGSLAAVGRRVLQRVIVGSEGAAPHTLNPSPRPVAF
ncbi:TauD/TfdA dioxygenase family protein [Haliea sp. E17]|uniref:TauD/TfdA dioxygenase family protein n=1 Tax=Haliea sp. E17 TaxID=3401576 RepID=UPI003AAE9673